MKIYIGTESIDLPTNFAADIDWKSPLFSEEGSLSISVTIPLTPKNKKLLSFAEDTGRITKMGDIYVQIEEGAFRRSGILNIAGTSENELECSIGFDESEAYYKFSDKKLSELEGWPVYEPEGDDKITAVINHLTDVMQEKINADYCVFPVLIYSETCTENDVETVYEYILNQPEMVGECLLVGREARKIKVKGDDGPTEISVPKGYGISPFIRVGALLRLLWNMIGFELLENPFDTHPQLKRLCLLNNTADTVVKGVIEYRQIMPDVTVDDFFDCLWCRFGARYFVNGNRRTVQIKFIRDILNSGGVINLSGRNTGGATQSFDSYRQLRLSADNSFNLAKRSADTFEDFFDQLGGICSDMTNVEFTTPGWLARFPYTFVRNKATGMFYKKSIIDTTKVELISSSFFDYDKKTVGLDYEELNSPDKNIPMVFEDYPMPFFDCKEKNLNTILRLTYSENTETNSEEEEYNECPLGLCFQIGVDNSGNYYFGSIFGLRSNGNDRFIDALGNRFDIDMVYHGETGLFHNFFSEYDAYLRHAGQQVRQSFLLDHTEISSVDLSQKIMIDNQPYLIESFTQELGSIGKQNVEFIMRSLRWRKPYDIVSEQYIPVFLKQKYYWSVVKYYESAISEFVKNYIYPYPTPGYVQSDFQYVSHELLTEPTDEDYLWLQVPTDEDYLNHIEHLDNYILKGKFIYTETSSIDPDIKNQKEVYENVDYKGGVRVSQIL